MRRVVSALILASISASYVEASPMKKPLDQKSFEAAKAKCGLTHARFFTGGFGLILPPGQDGPNAEQRRQLKCMDQELSEFEYHVVIESPPPA